MNRKPGEGETREPVWTIFLAAIWSENRTFIAVKIVMLCSSAHQQMHLLTHSMEQSPSWEANWFAASQEIPCVLWNPVPILSQPNEVLTPTSHFLKIHPNIILASTPGSPQRALSLRFPHQNPVHTSPVPRTCYMPRPSQSSRFCHPHDIG
jgi:hypothetical protein